MSDLAEFVLARLAEDEAAARAALAANERAQDNDWPELRHADSYFDAEIAEHIARHDPAWVLADVAAKRAIVELHNSWPVLVETPPEFSSDTADLNAMSFAVSQRMMWLTQQEYRARFGDEPPTAPILRLLAQMDAGHPNFDPAWRA